LRNFEYYAASSLQEACTLLEDGGEGARALAGGQSLIPLMKIGLTDISRIVDLKKIPGLSYIRIEGNELAIGALCTHDEVAHSDILKGRAPLISETARKIGHSQIRNRGTFGGSLCHADPSADLLPTMLTLDATMVLQNSHGGTRKIRALDFFKGAFSTALERGELLQEVRIPTPPAGTMYSFQKLSMPIGGFALVLASTLLELEGELCKKAKISIGGVTEIPFRAFTTERALTGQSLGDAKKINWAADLATENVKLMDGLGYPKELTARLVRTGTRRGLKEALDRGEDARHD
jgi:aerobic carbon-monoxide dehydrogenase medium subunit